MFSLGSVSSDSSSESTEASRRGYGSGASETVEYSCMKADEVVFPWLVRRSTNAWYAIIKLSNIPLRRKVMVEEEGGLYLSVVF